ncbi:MAG: hypothetical protein B5M53_12450 [Candidatus Cloacimonas sp. 4484_209]|nr:MAG: hypothetical protein B5M53_12450 [Candidatus Cloacimonas sp. 4484_209]
MKNFTLQRSAWKANEENRTNERTKASRFERYTTYFLVVGFLFHIAGLLSKRWILELVMTPFFGLALIFRGLAGIMINYDMEDGGKKNERG